RLSQAILNRPRKRGLSSRFCSRLLPHRHRVQWQPRKAAQIAFCGSRIARRCLDSLDGQKGGKKVKKKKEVGQLVSIETNRKQFTTTSRLGRRHWVLQDNGTRCTHALSDSVHWRQGYLGMTNSWARGLCSASSRFCCRCRKWCRTVDSRVGASA